MTCRALSSLLFLLFLTTVAGVCSAQQAAQLRVGPEQRYLYTSDGEPFFWLGDTAWELFHRLDREEAIRYLDDRAEKGFTVIQAVALAELDGLNTPNPYGHTPLIDNDPARPNEAYFKHVDFVIDEAAKRGIYIALLPTWGDKFNLKWGVGPEIFTPENAEAFGQFLGERYGDDPVVWVLGGDRNPDSEGDIEIVDAMARGIDRGNGGGQLMTFHPQGDSNSATWFHERPWLDFNMTQSGHHQQRKPGYEYMQENLALTPRKPTVDGEPCYEDHPVKGTVWNKRDEPGNYLPWFDAYDVRVAAYQSLLSGALGHTYGHHSIWQMWEPGLEPLSICRTPWQDALDHPGAFQMGYARRLLEARPWYRLRPAQEMVSGENEKGTDHIRASRDQNGAFALLYLPTGGTVTVALDQLDVQEVDAYWFDPRQNAAQLIGSFPAGGSHSFAAPGRGEHQDWLLVLDDAAAELPRLGTSYQHFTPTVKK